MKIGEEKTQVRSLADVGSSGKKLAGRKKIPLSTTTTRGGTFVYPIPNTRRKKIDWKKKKGGSPTREEKKVNSLRKGKRGKGKKKERDAPPTKPIDHLKITQGEKKNETEIPMSKKRGV